MRFIIKKSKNKNFSILSIESKNGKCIYTWRILNFIAGDILNPRLSIYRGKKKLKPNFFRITVGLIDQGKFEYNYFSSKMLVLNFKGERVTGKYLLSNITNKKWIFSNMEEK